MSVEVKGWSKQFTDELNELFHGGAGQALTAPIVFTSIALFNVLIAPLNSFPWVVNGCVEAVVSVRRLQRSLLVPKRLT